MSTLTLDEYRKMREDIASKEERLACGFEIKLSDREKLVNDYIMKLKLAELDKATTDPKNFPPSIHFFKSKKLIDESPIFKILQKLPKGGCLHVHDLTMGSLDLLRDFIEQEDVWVSNEHARLSFKLHPTQSGNFKPLTELKDEIEDFDGFLKDQLSTLQANTNKVFTESNSVWQKFKKAADNLNNLISNRSILKKYFLAVLKEYYDDNVKYIELRSNLPVVYDDGGNVMNPFQVAATYQEVLNQFKSDYPDFYGGKLIYAPSRKCEKESFAKHAKVAVKLKEMFPDLVVGFDVLGVEDLGPNLIDFMPEMFKLSQRINTFFHCGESIWYGGGADMNTLDSILLGAKRIGHALSLAKHPEWMELAKEKEVVVEICPIANQVFGFIDDLRNHPAGALLSNGVKVVVGCDDPGMWGAKGLSYDFYMMFMAVSSRKSDLKLLKQLAMNSLTYSCMSKKELENALVVWASDWNEFLNYVTKTYINT